MNQNRLAHRLTLLVLAAFLIPACGNDDDDPITPAAVAAALRIICSGGAGTYGGYGGTFRIENRNGTDTKILRTGTVNATVTPNVVKPYLGDNPLTVEADTTLTPDLGGYLTGDDGLNPATGLWVKSGAVLTLEPQIDEDLNPATFERVYLYFDEAAYLEGTIRVGRKTGLNDGANLFFESSLENFVITSSGLIDTRGTDFTAGTDGGNGGYVYAAIYGTTINAGRIDTTGGNGDNGGTGGAITLNSINYGVYNSGTLLSSGGRGLNGTGGTAGLIQLRTYTYGPVANSGQITARGGDGEDGGGTGGNLYMSTSYDGAVTSSGPIGLGGGSALTDGYGGNAGNLDIDANGSIRISGAITGTGGAAAGTDRTGGQGGFIDLYQTNNWDGSLGGGVFVGAELNLAGGTGDYGGAGGSINVMADENGNIDPTEDHVFFVGYSQILTNGGAGTQAGGDSSEGSSSVRNYPNYDTNDTYYLGSIVIEPDWDLTGGSGAAGSGGSGQDLSLYVGQDFWGEFTALEDKGEASIPPSSYPPYNQIILVTGYIRADGGDGGLVAGAGGGISAYCVFDIDFGGALTCTGGDAQDVPGWGGYIDFYAEDDLFVRAGINASAGSNNNAAFSRGTDYANLYGRHVTVQGGLLLRGSSNAAGTGGGGGSAEIRSTENSSTLSGTVSAKGGTGTPAGADGSLRIDGVLVDGAEATFP